MKFSNRTPDDLSPNTIARAIEATQPVLDLTQSNPTLCGFNYPPDILKGLSRPESLTYDPQAFGTLKAREVLAKYLSVQGQKVDPQNLVLTASTSEAYSYLFKLLGNPGDSFLVPIPGYPLLDHLLHLEGLELNPYSFQVHPDWPIDKTRFEASITPRTKGIITINPHNPTGAFLSENDQQVLLNLCEKFSMAYLSDEVFSDFAYSGQPQRIQNPKVLTFRLGGLSKSLGLPQLKLSWIEILGPDKLVEECKERLELIADTYLSLNTPVQVALEDLLAFAPDIQNQIKTRLLNNRNKLEKVLSHLQGVRGWPAQGGWYALVEVLREGAKDDELVIQLLKKHQVLVQPGGFYDFPTGCFLVISLLPQPDIFEAGVIQLRQFFENLEF
jgi:aspartate/methionine/tyrosine aminotransferase